MGTIWSDSRITNQLKKIADHHKLWLLYAIFTPIIFGFTGLVTYLANSTQIHTLYWMYLLTIAATSASWWLWTMWVIKQMADSHTDIIGMIKNISTDIQEIKKSILTKK
jgi:hypothetical protein